MRGDVRLNEVDGEKANGAYQSVGSPFIHIHENKSKEQLLDKWKQLLPVGCTLSVLLKLQNALKHQSECGPNSPELGEASHKLRREQLTNTKGARTNLGVLLLHLNFFRKREKMGLSI